MKILAFADLHEGITNEEYNILKELDFSICVLLGNIDEDSLCKIKEICNDRPIIGVEGNDDKRGVLERLDIKNIHNNLIDIRGYEFLGFSGCLPYKRMSEVYLYSQLECSVLLDYAGEADVLIAHNSPFGVHDNQDDMEHTGYKGILKYINRVNPKLVLHGHQHINDVTELDNGTYVVGVYGARLIDLDSI